MKALDKVFDTQVITGIIGDKFHSLKRERISYIYEEGRKQTRKDGIKVIIVTRRENPTEFNYQKSKWMEHWTMYQVTNYAVQLTLKI